MKKILKNACLIHLSFPTLYRYLLVHTERHLDGVEKAHRHRELCQFYVALFQGDIDPDMVDVTSDLYKNLHIATQELTDHLDEMIGLPLCKPVDDVEPFVMRFFNVFHDIAIKTLTATDEHEGD